MHQESEISSDALRYMKEAKLIIFPGALMNKTLFLILISIFILYSCKKNDYNKNAKFNLCLLNTLSKIHFYYGF